MKDGKKTTTTDKNIENVQNMVLDNQQMKKYDS